jgi:hypothetical protein
VVAARWTPTAGCSTQTTLDTINTQYGYTSAAAAPLGSGAIAAWANATTTQSHITISVFTP